MPLVTLPNALTDGAVAYGSEVYANDAAIVAVVHALADDNIASGAAIKGTKLSNVAGARVPTDRIEDDAVTADKLRDDAAVDGNRAVTTNHIRDVAVTKGKVAAGTLTKAQTALLVQTVAFTLNVGLAAQALTINRATSGANYIGQVRSAGAFATLATVTPGTAIPTATSDLLDLYLSDLAFASPNMTGNVVFVSLPKS